MAARPGAQTPAAPAVLDGGGTDRKPSVLVLACGALAREILALTAQHGLSHLDLHCLPAQLHNTPDRIAPAVAAALAERGAGYDEVLVAYADCGTGGHLDTVLAAHPKAKRIDGAHCYAFFAGLAAFDRLEDDQLGSFYLTDFLARHFQTMVIEPLGLDRHPELRDMYFGNYTRLVYLAQTEDAELTTAAEQAAATLGLPFVRIATGYGLLADFLQPAPQGSAAV